VVDGFRFTALDVRGRRIGRVRIEPMYARGDEGGDRDGESDSDVERGGVSHNGS
jgi:hypothetical protein